MQQEDLGNALHTACQQRDLQRVQSLLRQGANVNAVCSGGNTPMHAAAASGDAAVLTAVLAAEWGADLNIRNMRDETPLHTTVYHAPNSRVAQAVALLLSHGADHTLQNEWGDTALQMAAKYKLFDAVDACLAHPRRAEFGAVALAGAAIAAIDGATLADAVSDSDSDSDGESPAPSENGEREAGPGPAAAPGAGGQAQQAAEDPRLLRIIARLYTAALRDDPVPAQRVLMEGLVSFAQEGSMYALSVASQALVHMMGQQNVVAQGQRAYNQWLQAYRELVLNEYQQVQQERGEVRVSQQQLAAREVVVEQQRRQNVQRQQQLDAREQELNKRQQEFAQQQAEAAPHVHQQQPAPVHRSGSTQEPLKALLAAAAAASGGDDAAAVTGLPKGTDPAPSVPSQATAASTDVSAIAELLKCASRGLVAVQPQAAAPSSSAATSGDAEAAEGRAEVGGLPLGLGPCSAAVQLQDPAPLSTAVVTATALFSFGSTPATGLPTSTGLGPAVQPQATAPSSAAVAAPFAATVPSSAAATATALFNLGSTPDAAPSGSSKRDQAGRNLSRPSSKLAAGRAGQRAARTAAAAAALTQPVVGSAAEESKMQKGRSPSPDTIE